MTNKDELVFALSELVRWHGLAVVTDLLLQAGRRNTAGMHEEAVIFRDIKSLEACTQDMINNHPLRRLHGKL